MTTSKNLLIAGALLGLSLALGAALLETRPAIFASSDGISARVNDATISAQEFDRAVEALAGDKRNAITNADRMGVLERLIEEELLVQRGVEIGLVDSDRSVRKAIVNAMVGYVLANRSGHDPTDDEVAEFYAKNLDYFSKTTRSRVRRIFVKSGDADGNASAMRVSEIAARLKSGEAFGDVAADLSDPILPGVPDTLLPPAKLREYLGPTLTQTALSMPKGSVSQPIRSGSGHHFLYVVDVKKEVSPPLVEVRAQVVAEYKRRSDDEALRDYLNWLKSEADIDRNQTGPAP